MPLALLPVTRGRAGSWRYISTAAYFDASALSLQALVRYRPALVLAYSVRTSRDCDYTESVLLILLCDVPTITFVLCPVAEICVTQQKTSACAALQISLSLTLD